MSSAHPKQWHAQSQFGTGPRRPLDREQRSRFKFLLSTHYRARRLTPKAERVGLALVKRLGIDGRLDPSHATLADDAACDARTVRRALAVLRGLGLVVWVKRLVRSGWRVEQTSSAYMLTLTENPAPIAPILTGGQRVRETPKLDIQEPLPLPSPAELEAAERALRERRAVVEQRLMKG